MIKIEYLEFFFSSLLVEKQLQILNPGNFNAMHSRNSFDQLFLCVRNLFLFFFCGFKTPVALFLSSPPPSVCGSKLLVRDKRVSLELLRPAALFSHFRLFGGWGWTTCTHSCGLDTLGRDIFDIFSSFLCENLFNSIRAHILEFLFSPSILLFSNPLWKMRNACCCTPFVGIAIVSLSLRTSHSKHFWNCDRVHFSYVKK